jgi:hypothetical protein
MLTSAVFLEKTFKIHDLKLADANTLRLLVPKLGAWLILTCQISDVEDTCCVSSGMVVIGLDDTHQERAVIIRVLPSR